MGISHFFIDPIEYLKKRRIKYCKYNLITRALLLTPLSVLAYHNVIIIVILSLWNMHGGFAVNSRKGGKGCVYSCYYNHIICSRSLFLQSYVQFFFYLYDTMVNERDINLRRNRAGGVHQNYFRVTNLARSSHLHS